MTDRVDSAQDAAAAAQPTQEIWQRRLSFNRSEPLKEVSIPPAVVTKVPVAETDDSDYDTVTSRTPLRKKACFAPVAVTIDSNTPSTYSPDLNSHSDKKITSILRNKVTMAVPKLKHLEKPREHKLRAFVGMLFLAIVFLIGFAYIYYYQSLMQRLYYERVRFLADEKVLQVFDEQGLESIRIDFGQTIPADEKVFDCRKRDQQLFANPGVCKEWMNRARLNLARVSVPGNLQCYEVTWKSLAADFYPTDCFDMSSSFWFGGGTINQGQRVVAGWPLNTVSVPMTPFTTSTSSPKTSSTTWGAVLRREFLTSTAASLSVDETVPLWISVNHNGSQKLCLQARANQYPYKMEGDSHSTLSYTVCTSPDLATLETTLADKTMWDGLRKNEMEVLKKLIEDPVWRFHPKVGDNATVENLVKFTNDIMAVVWTSPGYLLIDNPWEKQLGDWDFDSSSFQGLSEALEIINRKGFKVAVSVRPYVSTFSATYKEGLAFSGTNNQSRGSGVWLSSQDGSPSLTKFEGQHSIALPDVSSPEVSDWVAGRLRRLMTSYDLDALFVETTTADVLPRYRAVSDNATNPSKLGQLFLEAARKAGDVIATNSAVEMPRIPTLVSLAPVASTWDSLEGLLPVILSLGVIGYPFLLPPPVGGFLADGSASLPDRELYIRWLQLNTFLPVIQYSFLPSAYDAEIERLAGDLATLRQSLVLPLLQKHGEDSIINGLPLVRPLWMLDPHDKNTHNIGDEFCVGDELLVAPVLKAGQRERDIYLPKGVWKDGVDGTLRKGGRWIHNHKVKLDQVAYFHRMPEGSRI